MRPVELKELEGTWRCFLDGKHYDLTIRVEGENSFITEVETASWKVINEIQGIASIEQNESNAIIKIGNDYAISIWMLYPEPNKIALENEDIGRCQFIKI